MHRLPRLLVAACLAILVLPAAATAANRMFLGFQDDQSFRFAPDRMAMIERADETGATLFRLTVEWRAAAPTRPASPSNPFDPTYRLDDVDELVRSAQERGIEVLLSIWATPEWANGGKGPNVAPRNANDFKSFARALAARYSGRYPGYPAVRFWSVWNEPNLEQFLTPQYNARGRSVGPAIYAKLYRAAYAGIKAGNPTAVVGLGETSPRGRDKPSRSVQDSHSPGRFAELVSKTRPRVKFDAYAQHPYSTEVRAKPTQRVKWPNVTLSQLKRFETALDTWYKKKNVPIWITEYGYQTRPPRSDGVSYATQAAYERQALTIAKKDPRVQMFVWFIFRDSPANGNQWQAAGGLLASNGVAKPAYARFGAFAPGVDARNAEIRVKAGTRNPVVKVSALELKARNETGTPIGINYEIFQGRRFVGRVAVSTGIGRDGWLTFRPPLVAKKNVTYRLQVTATDVNGNSVSRTITVTGT